MVNMWTRSKWLGIKYYLQGIAFVPLLRDIRSLADDFFLTVRDRDCTRDMFSVNYDKPMDDNMKKVAVKYARDKDILLITPLQTKSESKYNLQ